MPGFQGTTQAPPTASPDVSTPVPQTSPAVTTSQPLISSTPVLTQAPTTIAMVSTNPSNHPCPAAAAFISFCCCVLTCKSVTSQDQKIITPGWQLSSQVHSTPADPVTTPAPVTSLPLASTTPLPVTDNVTVMPCDHQSRDQGLACVGVHLLFQQVVTHKKPTAVSSCASVRHMHMNMHAHESLTFGPVTVL